MSIKIATDSTSDINPEEAKRLGVGLVPAHVFLDGKDYLDGVTLSTEDLYRKMPESKSATTCQPNPNEFRSVWKNMNVGEDDGILAIQASSKLSGMCGSAMLASKEFLNIRVVDSLLLSLGIKFLVFEALEMSQKGYDIETLARKIEQLREKVKLYAVFDTLKYLERGGRIGKMQAWAAAITKMKPIITLKDGEIFPLARPHTKEEATKQMIEKFLSDGKMSRVGVLHTQVPDEALAIKEILQKEYPSLDISIVQLGPALGVHAGPGVVGVCGLLE